MKKMIAMVSVCIFICGCATSGNVWKEVVGVSTKEVENARPDALTKVFDLNHKTCYDKAEALLRRMPYVSIYHKDKGMIAVYVINPNTTAVGIFFKEIDSGHTQVDVSSASTPTKEWVANNIFSGKVIPMEKSNIVL
ncbi:MAG: hypothetical protein V1682_04925 [Candidatus Omnitrophota bacterium]